VAAGLAEGQDRGRAREALRILAWFAGVTAFFALAGPSWRLCGAGERRH